STHRAERVAAVGYRFHVSTSPDVAGEAQAIGKVAACDAAFRGHPYSEIGDCPQFVLGQGIRVRHDPLPCESSVMVRPQGSPAPRTPSAMLATRLATWALPGNRRLMLH